MICPFPFSKDLRPHTLHSRRFIRPASPLHVHWLFYKIHSHICECFFSSIFTLPARIRRRDNNYTKHSRSEEHAAWSKSATNKRKKMHYLRLRFSTAACGRNAVNSRQRSCRRKRKKRENRLHFLRIYSHSHSRSPTVLSLYLYLSLSLMLSLFTCLKVLPSLPNHTWKRFPTHCAGAMQTQRDSIYARLNECRRAFQARFFLSVCNNWNYIRLYLCFPLFPCGRSLYNLLLSRSCSFIRNSSVLPYINILFFFLFENLK